MQRRRAEEPLPSADRWLLSWSDFVTLLLALFAAMYAGASVDLAKAKLVAQSVGSALGSAGPGKGEQRVAISSSSSSSSPSTALAVAAPSTTAEVKPGDAAAATSAADEKHTDDHPTDDKHDMHGERSRELVAALRGAMAGIAGSDRVRIVHEAAAVGIDIDATLLFATADARLAPQAEAALSALSGVLASRSCSCSIIVEGHTDSLPIHTAQFGSNWELSAMRAAMVARRLSEQGIGNDRLSAVGRGDTRPLASNDTPAGRASNRRVHLIVTLATAVH